MSTVIGIVVLLLIIAVVLRLGSRSRPTGGNGDNRDAAMRYGAGPH